ncbi:MAG: hypothetical protein ACI8PT_000316 [Gammaproteobacteria bacterium]|jgi:hypothetical protein
MVLYALLTAQGDRYVTLRTGTTVAIEQTRGNINIRPATATLAATHVCLTNVRIGMDDLPTSTRRIMPVTFMTIE